MDYKQIQDIIKGFENSNITTLELEMDSLKLKLIKQVETEDRVVVTNPHREAKKVVEPVQEVNNDYAVKSPLVGTYYASASPSEPPFVQVGQTVKKGDTLCIIEAMKIMNEITAPIDGTITDIQVENGAVIGFDQVILTIG